MHVHHECPVEIRRDRIRLKSRFDTLFTNIFHDDRRYGRLFDTFFVKTHTTWGIKLTSTIHHYHFQSHDESMREETEGHLRTTQNTWLSCRNLHSMLYKSYGILFHFLHQRKVFFFPFTSSKPPTVISIRTNLCLMNTCVIISSAKETHCFLQDNHHFSSCDAFSYSSRTSRKKCEVYVV